MKTLKNIFLLLPVFTVQMLSGQTLDDYIRMLTERSTELKQREISEQISREKVNEAAVYPDFKVQGGVFLLQPETRAGNQRYKIGISQQFPWFGTNKAVRNHLEKLAERETFDTELKKRDLVFLLKKMYYRLYALHRQKEVLQRHLEILETYEKTALEALSNARSDMSGVLLIRMGKNDLQAQLKEVENHIRLTTRKFNRLLERNEDTEISIPQEIHFREMPGLDKSLDKHPVLMKIAHEHEVIAADNKRIEKKSKPKITLGWEYIDVFPVGNTYVNDGKDITMPVLGVSIPLFNRSYRSKIKQNELKKQGLAYEKMTWEKELKDALEQAVTEWENILVRIDALDKNIEETERIIHLKLKAYENGVADYEEIVKNQLRQVKYEWQRITLIEKALIERAKIEYLIKNE
jgi:outer membrane protein TolC